MLKKKQWKCQKKKPDKGTNMTVESSNANTTTDHPRQRKKLREQKKGGKQFKTVVILKIWIW